MENTNHRILLRSENIYLIPLHSTYNYICNDHLEKFYVHFRAEIFAGQDIFESVDSCISLPVDTSRLQTFLERVQGSTIEDIVYCKSFLFDIVLQMIQSQTDPSPIKLDTTIRYREVFRFIKQNCSAQLTTNQVSQHVKPYFPALSKSFKKDTGKTIKNCIDSMVLQSAKEKLILSDMSIKEIAYWLKFTDEFYFSRFFKKHVSISPKEYRTRNRM